ncbi:MAG: sodium:glutamate symporter [Clostridiaceae bacterium]
MESTWFSVADFMYLSLFIGIATVLKRKFNILNKFLLPTSMIAGFLGLIFGPAVLNIVPFNVAVLEKIVYHLMAIGFIALALKDRNHKKNANSLNTGLIIVSTYIIQGIVAFSLSLFLAYTFFPNLFPVFGLILPLGYGQGPGQAYSIGTQWENLGFLDGGQIGLTIATMGFLWACLGGVILLNFLTRKKEMKHVKYKNDIIQKNIVEESEPGEIPLSTGLDKITVQLILIGIVYLVTYLTIKVLSSALSPLGTFGMTMSQLLWGFHFLIGTMYAMLLRIIYDYLKKKKIVVQNYPNNYLLQRISGASFDFMIAASITALSIYAIKRNLIPILLISFIGGLITILYIIYICKKIYKVHVLEYIIALYGMLTGTISTGLALLREVDPDFNTQVAENLVLGSAYGLVLGFPLMLILNIPVIGYTNNNPIMYLYTILALFIYLLVIIILMKKNNKNS